MSDTNSFPEWLRELGAKVDNLVNRIDKHDRTIEVLVETAKHHEAMLAEVIVALDKLVDITNQHRRELDLQDERVRRLES
jgi:hypothetical protein